MPSTYLNLMRHGKESFNCAVTFASHVITVAPYIGTIGAASPLLARFSPSQTSEVVGANITFNWTGATFGLGSDVTGISLHVGLQYINSTTMRIVLAYQPTNAVDRQDTVLPANATLSSSLAASTALQNGPIVWLGMIYRLERVAGAWVFTNALFSYGGPGSLPDQ